MLLSAACALSGLTKHTPVECFSFHCSSALWWTFHARSSHKKCIKGDDGLRIIAVPINDAHRTMYAISRMCAFPMVPHVYAVVPFVLSAWLGLPSAESSNVALFVSCLFYALCVCFEDFNRFAFPLLATSVSLLGYAELSHRIDDRTKWWVAFAHGASAMTAFLFCNAFYPWDLLGGVCAGLMVSEACIRSATQLKNTKSDASATCRVAAVVSLLSLPMRFYAGASLNDKLAAALQLLFILSSIWFYAFDAEWHAGKARVAGCPTGYAVVALGAVHVLLRKLYF